MLVSAEVRRYDQPKFKYHTTLLEIRSPEEAIRHSPARWITRERETPEALQLYKTVFVLADVPPLPSHALRHMLIYTK